MFGENQFRGKWKAGDLGTDAQVVADDQPKVADGSSTLANRSPRGGRSLAELGEWLPNFGQSSADFCEWLATEWPIDRRRWRWLRRSHGFVRGRGSEHRGRPGRVVATGGRWLGEYRLDSRRRVHVMHDDGDFAFATEMEIGRARAHGRANSARSLRGTTRNEPGAWTAVFPSGKSAASCTSASTMVSPSMRSPSVRNPSPRSAASRPSRPARAGCSRQAD